MTGRRIVYDCIRDNPGSASRDIVRITGLSSDIVSSSVCDMRKLLGKIRNITVGSGISRWEIVPGSSPPSGRSPGKSETAMRRRKRALRPPRPAELELPAARPECFLASVWRDPVPIPDIRRGRVITVTTRRLVP